MSNYLKTILGITISFFTTITLNTIVGYASSENGIARIGIVPQKGNINAAFVIIENLTDDFITNLTIKLPESAEDDSITSNAVLHIERNSHKTNPSAKYIEISKIPPNLVTTIIIPGIHDGQQVEIVNRNKLKILVKYDQKPESVLKKNLESAFTSAIIYLIFMILFVFHDEKKRTGIREELKQLREDHQKNVNNFQVQRENIKKETEDIRAIITKQRILLLSRLADYAKELDFWRSAVKEILLMKNSNSCSGDDLVKRVTVTLKTHGTNYQPNEFDTIKILNKWATAIEKNNKETN